MSVIGPRPGLWNQDILTAERDKYNANDVKPGLNILNYCKDYGADRILFAQSFGDIKDHAEKHPVLHPDMKRKFSFTTDHTIYVMTKNFAVDMIENYHLMYTRLNRQKQRLQKREKHMKKRLMN